MEISVTHNGIELIVTGDVIKEESENNISEGFEANEIRDEFNNNVWDDLLEEDLQDIEDMCLKQSKKNDQSEWENANV